MQISTAGSRRLYVRAHGPAVGAGIRHQQHVAFLRGGQQAVVSEDVRTLANRSHDIGELGARLVETGEIHDLMVRTIECRPDQRVHSGGDAHVARSAFGLELRDARDQHARGRHEEAPRLHPQLDLRERGFHLGERGIELREIEARLFRALRHAETAANVHDTNVRELLDETSEQRRRLLPVPHIEHATACVSMQADDLRRPLSARALAKAWQLARTARRTWSACPPCERASGDRDPCPYRRARRSRDLLNTSGQFSTT